MFKNVKLTDTQIRDLVNLIESATEWHDFEGGDNYNEARRFDRIYSTLTKAINQSQTR
jgi:hypothetical protein